MNIDMNTISQ